MKKITIVIPVYNEKENIREAILKIQDTVSTEHDLNIIYDSENDTSLPELDKLENDTGISVNRIRNKYGKGVLNAIKTGLETAVSEYVVVTMADLSDPPYVINDMVKKADAESADVVCASRYMKGGSQNGGPVFKSLLSRCAGLSLCWIAGLPVHDPTNSFKLYKKTFLDNEQIESTGGFELGIELVVKAWKHGYRVCEVPTSWQDRSGGESHFHLWKWLPKYLKWYIRAFLP